MIMSPITLTKINS